MKNQKGFTLIELLVVIAIIGILAVGAVQVYSTQLKNARDAARLSDLGVLNSATAVYYADKAEYPASDTKANFALALAGPYVQAIPNAQGANPYFYTVNTAGGLETEDPSQYEYSVALEGTSDETTAKMDNDGGNQAGAAGVGLYEVGSNMTLLVGVAGSETTAPANKGINWDNAGTGSDTTEA